jgi:hypothetical protein
MNNHPLKKRLNGSENILALRPALHTETGWSKKHLMESSSP